jgi:transcriptional regulator
MYISKQHALPDIGEVQQLMMAFPLGAWVVAGPDGLVANHIPFLLDTSRGRFGTLLGHVARANPVWRGLSQDRSSVVMFQGPQSYITPGWYPGKDAHGKVVPTWNYAVAHAHGVARAINDKFWLHELLVRLTAAHESQRASPWQVADAPADYIDKLMGAIVGIELPIDRLMGKL